jgi:8-oxo-dGTP pyrophosphatase MutT (NUDIX family)
MAIKVVGAFLEHDIEFLLLKRALHKPQGNKKGLVAGKVGADENELAALLREIEEETGYIAEESVCERLGEGVWNHDGTDILFVTYKVKLPYRINVILNPDEHASYEWVTAKQCFSMPDLVPGVDDLLREYYGEDL